MAREITIQLNDDQEHALGAVMERLNEQEGEELDPSDVLRRPAVQWLSEQYAEILRA